jgi:hypothetical protein
MRRVRDATCFQFIPLIYRVTEQEITIVAVAHAKMKPGYWINRE